MPAFDRQIAATDCVNCGQCRIFCPTGAISIKSDEDAVWEALGDPNVRVVAQIAPAVRVAVGDAFGLQKGRSVMGKIVNVLHRMGFDEVYDTTFSADLTIMEETAEFIDRVKNGGKLPLLTSCCPAWVKFVGDQFPDYSENVSTCRSPQDMMSGVVKEYYRDPAHAAGKKTIMVSFMPCTAKKMEANRPNSFTKGEKDTNYVITTTELIKDDPDDRYRLCIPRVRVLRYSVWTWFRRWCDLWRDRRRHGGRDRRLAPDHSKATIEEIAECGVRDEGFIREFSIPYEGLEVKICVASGLANARKVMEQVQSKEKEYHLIEIMACRRGCIMGAAVSRDWQETAQRQRVPQVFITQIRYPLLKSRMKIQW